MDQGLNWALAQALNGLAGRFPLLDQVMIFAAKYLIVLVFLSLGFWWFLRTPNDVGKRAALAAVIAVVWGQIANMAVSYLVFVPRPFIAHDIDLLVSAARDSSFPSDHATAAFVVAVTALRWATPGRRLLLLAAILIGFSRVFVGAHYPADVVASAVLATVWAFLLFKLDSRLSRPFNWVIGAARQIHLD
ncbi:MAG: phosphatase PAP2 family protein [Chloroflexi bacterium]|nr:phosphatase PAP2 family protein [Chloroflexota bacterium]